MVSQRSNLAGIGLGLGLAFFAAYQQFKLPVVLPVLLERHAYDRFLAGAFMSVYALAGLILSLWLGRVIERSDALKPIYAAMGVFICGNALGLIWPEQGGVFLAGRALEGIAFAALAIVGPVLANANASTRRLPLVIGLTATWIPVGQVLAILLAPAALGSYGWQLLWWLGMAGAIVFSVWTWQLARSGRVDFSARQPATDASDSQSTVAPPAISRRQRIALLMTATVFMSWSCQYFAYMTWLPLYLVEMHDLAVSGAVIGYLIPVVLVMVFCIVTGMLLRMGVPLGLLLALSMAAQAAVWWLLPYTGGGLGGVLSLVVYGCGAGIVPTCLFAMPSAILARGRGIAGAFGFVMTGRNLGVLIGPVLLAQAFKLTGAWSLAAPIFGSVTSFGLIVALFLGWRLTRLQEK